MTAHRSDDHWERAVMETIRHTRYRREHGPICALCLHCSFERTDLPNLPASPNSITDDWDATIKQDRCQRMRRGEGGIRVRPEWGGYSQPLWITPDSGSGCVGFERDPNK